MRVAPCPAVPFISTATTPQCASSGAASLNLASVHQQHRSARSQKSGEAPAGQCRLAGAPPSGSAQREPPGIGDHHPDLDRPAARTFLGVVVASPSRTSPFSIMVLKPPASMTAIVQPSSEPASSCSACRWSALTAIGCPSMFRAVPAPASPAARRLRSFRISCTPCAARTSALACHPAIAQRSEWPGGDFASVIPRAIARCHACCRVLSARSGHWNEGGPSA